MRVHEPPPSDNIDVVVAVPRKRERSMWVQRLLGALACTGMRLFASPTVQHVILDPELCTVHDLS